MHCIKDSTQVAFFNKTFVGSSFTHDVREGGGGPGGIFYRLNLRGEFPGGGDCPVTPPPPSPLPPPPSPVMSVCILLAAGQGADI